MKVISRDKMRSMPWKNGGGTTVEVAIEPAGSNAVSDLFQWRLSSATVTSPGPFSHFANFDRALVVLTEPGLELNGRILAPYEPFYFEGEAEILCRPLGTAIKDLGVIAQRGKFKVEIEAWTGTSVLPEREVLSEHVTCFVFDPETENAWRFDPGTRLDLAPFAQFRKFILIRIKAVT